MEESSKNHGVAGGLLCAALLAGCARGPEETFTNPLDVSLGDPFVLKDGDGYYCYGTSGMNGFRGWRSANLVEWEALGPVFNAQRRGLWAQGDFWAPEVVKRGDTYFMFYSARWIENKSLRVGVAVSDSPAGPFVEALGRPLFDPGWAVIDADPFIDTDGTPYLYFVRDCSENVVDGVHESHIYGARLADDLLSLAGEPALLARPEQGWECPAGGWRWNEGPFMLKHDGRYYLMYSGNFFADRNYSIGYAVGNSPMGPFVKADNNPALFAAPGQSGVSGPGHNSVTVSPDGKELWAAYHVHADPLKGGGDRRLALDRIVFDTDGSLSVAGPTMTRQRLPGGSRLGKAE